MLLYQEKEHLAWEYKVMYKLTSKTFPKKNVSVGSVLVLTDPTGSREDIEPTEGIRGSHQDSCSRISMSTFYLIKND